MSFSSLQMNEETCRKKMKPQMVVGITFNKTKRFFLKAFRNIHFIILRGYRELPRNPFDCAICFGSRKIGPKLQETDNEAAKKAQRNGDEICSKSYVSMSDQSQTSNFKDEKKERKYSRGNEEEPSFSATESFAQKMEELEMMDVNNGDHVMDIDEVIHQYSLLTSPVYLDIVDKFFMDVYVELHLPKPSKSRSNSMRKLGSSSIHGSMRKLESGHTSMRKMDSATVHGSMRKVGSASVHSSMRKVGSASVHGSLRKSGSMSVHGSMRKLGSGCVHGSMRNLGPIKL